jgi:uncharacterized protein YggU (UPF0235/DUF167 family)
MKNLTTFRRFGSIKISHAAGKEALDMALYYVQQQPSSKEMDVPLFKKWKDYVMTKLSSPPQENKVLFYSLNLIT